ncbi:MAG TPA: SUF system NifU family Fe-S cluster assembly protein [Xanthomonadales bacterium]|nr:SUF system NifU family Fe-S cluster assembly protein [Xanthomonadales bacterium]
MNAESPDKAAMAAQNSTVTEEDIALADLYRDAVVGHAVEPVGYRQEIAVTHRHELYNPLCGDKIEMQFQLENDRIEAAAFDGEACAICMASASMLCEAAPHKSAAEISQQHELLVTALKDKTSKPGLDSLQALLAVRRYPARVRCALLPWEAAVKAFGLGKE